MRWSEVAGSRLRSAAPVLVGIVWLGLGTGCDQLFGLDRVPDPAAAPNAYACGCTCFPGENFQVSRQFDNCLPAALNPNRDGGVPTPSDLATDCDTRVKPVLVGILTQCGSNQMRRLLEEDPGACTCSPVTPPRFVSQCNGDCVAVPLASDCSNDETATSVGALPAVCIAEPAGAGSATMGRVLLGDRSTCSVSGTLSVVRGSDTPVSQPASGIIEIAGQPCPGQSCDVAVLYRLDGQGSLEFDSFAGFASVEFRDLRASGGSLSATTLDGAGNGELAASSLASSGRGLREEEVLFGTISDTESASFVGANVEPVSVGVDWAGAQCALVGSLLGVQIEGEETDIVLDALGTLDNQPPHASGGPDRDVECTSPSGATVTLSAAASADPDGNIVFRDWWIGHAGGAEIADLDGDGLVSVAQGFGTQTYALSVVDGAMSVSRDAVDVRVVDTTPPAITQLSVDPRSLRPRNHEMVSVRVSVSANDACGTASCSITAITSSQPINDLGDGDTEVDWVVTGPLTAALRAETSGTNDRLYTIDVGCADTSGNSATRSVQVRVRATRTL